MPPWERARVIQKADISRIGSQAVIEQKIFGLLPSRWVAQHTAYDPPRMFEDIQVSGPFASWRHKHVVEPHPAGAVLRDEIEFEPPASIFGGAAASLFILPDWRKYSSSGTA